MDIRHVITFLRVVNRKSFTRAGEELHYVQSTVTYQIKQLEKELGFPLLDRVGSGVTLTPLGREFLPIAESIVQLQQEALNLNNSQQGVRGTLCLGVSESLVSDTLVDVLPRYSKLYPQVDIQVTTGRRGELLSGLRQNRLDLIYLTGPDSQEPDLHCCYSRRERLIFVASAGHPLARRSRIPTQDCLVYPYLDTERSDSYYNSFKQLASLHGLSLRQSAVLNNTQAVAEILQGNSAFSYLPEYSVKKELDSGRLAELKVDFEPQYYYSRILYHKDKWVPALMEDLIRLIREFRPDDEAEADEKK